MTRFIIIAGLLMFAINAFTQIAQTGQKGLLRTHSAQTLGKGVLGVNTAGYFSFDKDYVLDLIEFQEKPLSPGDTQAVRVTSAIDPTFVSTYYNLSYGLFNFWDISLGLPFYIDKTSGASGSDNGPGDMTFSMKINYPPYEHFRVFDMTYYGCFFIPTGHQDKGLFPRQPYYSSAQNIKPTSVYYRPMITNLSDSTYGLNTTDADTLYRQLTNAIDSNKIAKENFYYGAGYLSFLAKMLWTFDASEINPDVNLKMHFNFGALFTGRSDKDNIFELGSALTGAVPYSVPIRTKTVFRTSSTAAPTKPKMWTISMTRTGVPTLITTVTASSISAINVPTRPRTWIISKIMTGVPISITTRTAYLTTRTNAPTTLKTATALKTLTAVPTSTTTRTAYWTRRTNAPAIPRTLTGLRTLMDAPMSRQRPLSRK